MMVTTVKTMMALLLDSAFKEMDCAARKRAVSAWTWSSSKSSMRWEMDLRMRSRMETDREPTP